MSRNGQLRRRVMKGGAVTAPDHQIIREVQRRLGAQQGEFEPRQLMPILDRVVGTVLSQHTSDVNSGRAFALLKARFSAWEQVAHAPVEEIEDAIRCGGLARQKARRIKEILNAVDEREGRIDLSRLHDLGDVAAEGYLTSLPGVGPKTAACVLAFSMGRAAFPIDTHVHRVVTRLGWVPAGTTAEKAYRLLARRVPADIRYDLHLALIHHDRTVCLARRPRCEGCVLLDLCPYGQVAVRQRAEPISMASSTSTSTSTSA
jgi:endonuclease III